MAKRSTDFDGAWKEALEIYFERFMAFCFPAIHAEIDWEQGYEFLDKELQQITREAKLGRNVVDKLAKVWRRDGVEAWVLVHIEVQGQVEPAFGQRIYRYHYRLTDHYNRPVVSLAVLSDTDPKWRPSEYSEALWGCEIEMRFPIVKLLDFGRDWPALERNANPFAVVVMAHLKTLETHRKISDRLAWKLRLVKGLYKRGYQRKDIIELFRFIDWLMILPEAAARAFQEEINRYEEELTMPYVTSVERMSRQDGRREGRQEGIQEGLRKGRQEGIQEGIQKGIREGRQEGRQEGLLLSITEILAARFGSTPDSLRIALQAIDDLAQLTTLLRQAVTAESLEAFQQLLEAKPAD